MHGLDSIEILDVTGCATVIYYTKKGESVTRGASGVEIHVKHV